MTTNGRGQQALRSFKQRLQTLPITLAADVARRASPELTTITQAAHASGKTVYGEPRPVGVNGNVLDLVDTGTTQRDLKFVTIPGSTIVRAALPEKYMRFLIGRYGVLPNGRIPVAMKRALDRLVHETKL